MADDAGDKTEEPTAKKLAQARSEGKVAKSQEINTTVMLAVSLGLLLVWAPFFLRQMVSLFWATQGRAHTFELTPDQVPGLFHAGILFVGTLLIPLVIPLALAALGVNVAQVGFNLSLKPLQPSLSKLNPMNGIKRLFGVKGLVELGKSLFKIGVIATVAFLTIREKLPVILSLSGTTVGQYLETVCAVTLLLGLRVVIALIVLSVLDFLFQRHQHRKELKMTKQEVKDEMKQSEGDPAVKGKVRGLMRQMARDRMLEAIKRADVVVTNPVHVAVALRYDPAKAGAPEVVAKGARKMAQRIKDIAREHEVPIVENPPLARQLFKLTEVGDLVPSSLYKAVAEVLAFVYRLKGRRVT